MSPARRRQLHDAIDVLDARIAAAADPKLIVAELVDRFEGRFRFAGGADELRLLGVGTTSTSGAQLVLRHWRAAAMRRLNKEPVNA